jgi:hypothetical protein
MSARIDIDAALVQWPDYLGTLAGAGELLDLGVQRRRRW